MEGKNDNNSNNNIDEMQRKRKKKWCSDGNVDGGIEITTILVSLKRMKTMD